MEANSEMMKELAEKFKNSETVKALDRYFSKKSMMEILGVERKENVHSKFLGWLFENEVTSKKAIDLLFALLRKIVERCESYSGNSIPCDVTEKTIFNVELYLEDVVEVKDSDYNEEGNGFYWGRTDIVLKIKYIKEDGIYTQYVIIENKVFDVEHEITNNICKDRRKYQTDIYYCNYIKDEPNAIFVFLTRPKVLSNKIKGPKDNSHFIWIDYQDLMDGILVPLLQDFIFINSRVSFVIMEYVLALGHSYEQNDLMAISPSLKGLVLYFYTTYKSLLKGIVKPSNILPHEICEFLLLRKAFLQKVIDMLSIISSKDNCFSNEETRFIEELRTFFNDKDRTKYMISFELNGEKLQRENLSKTDLVFELISFFLKHNPDTDLNKLQSKSLFHFSLRGKTNAITNMVVIGKDEYNKLPTIEAKNRWKNVADPREIYVQQTGWDGQELMRKFINHIKTLDGWEKIDIKESFIIKK